MKTRTVFAILSLFLMLVLAMPPTQAGTTPAQCSVTQTMQAVDVMAVAYEMTPTFTMECPWLGYESEQVAENIIFAECLQFSPPSPEASPTDFVRLWYIDIPEDANGGQDITQHYWRC